MLGTCAGFQRGVLEFARNVLGITDAHHAEYEPGAGRAPLIIDEPEVLQEPVSQPWGARDCAFRDPSGNLVRIAQA